MATMQRRQTGYYQDNGQQYQQPQQTPQLALTAPQHTTAQEQQAPAIYFVSALDNKLPTTPVASSLQSVQQDEAKVDIMIDNGAATHVCPPPWFAPNTPMYTLQQGQRPQLRTAADMSTSDSRLFPSLCVKWHSKTATVWSNKSNWININATSNVSTANNWLYIGSGKDTCGKGPMSSQDTTFTFHDKQMLAETSPSSKHNEQPWC